MNRPSLRADCAHCVALCCVALSFERSAEFALDKPAGHPCPNLSANFSCAIHAQRVERGFSGCIAYECMGAGQRVTALFGAAARAPDSATRARIGRSFAIMRRIHDALHLLEIASVLPLSHQQRQHAREIESDLIAASSSLTTLDAPDIVTLLRRCSAYLHSLQTLVPRPIP